MPKADANIRVGADATAFSQTMDGLEKGIVKKMEKIGQVFMGALGIKAAAQSIASGFSAFTQPAAELENVSTSLGVVMGNAEAAERLTGSLQRLAVRLGEGRARGLAMAFIVAPYVTLKQTAFFLPGFHWNLCWLAAIIVGGYILLKVRTMKADKRMNILLGLSSLHMILFLTALAL